MKRLLANFNWMFAAREARDVSHYSMIGVRNDMVPLRRPSCDMFWRPSRFFVFPGHIPKLGVVQFCALALRRQYTAVI